MVDDAAMERDVARMLRVWFDVIIEGLPADALDLLRMQCLRAERTPANVKIVATIDRRLVRLRGCPPIG